MGAIDIAISVGAGISDYYNDDDGDGWHNGADDAQANPNIPPYPPDGDLDGDGVSNIDDVWPDHPGLGPPPVSPRRRQPNSPPSPPSPKDKPTPPPSGGSCQNPPISSLIVPWDTWGLTSLLLVGNPGESGKLDYSMGIQMRKYGHSE